VAQIGQNRYALLAMGAPQVGHLLPGDAPVAADAGGASPASFAPQYAQNGIVASTAWPQEEQVSPTAMPAPDFAPLVRPYTRVAGAPGGVTTARIDMADGDSGFPQSMQ
jgi:hypothetical protein